MAWIQISTDSKSLNMQIDYQVLIPQKIGPLDKGCIDKVGPYPAMYFLHEERGDGTELLRYTSLERYIWGMPLAVVLPNGHNSWWRKLENGMDYSYLLSQEIPQKTEKWFNVSKKTRYIGGYSMGGYGALHTALSSPSLYSYVMAFGSAVKENESGFELDADRAEMIFGKPSEHTQNDVNLFTLAEKAATSGETLPVFYISCGIQDNRFDNNSNFAGHLKKLGFQVEFKAEDGGHDWDYMDKAIRNAFVWLVEKEGM